MHVPGYHTSDSIVFSVPGCCAEYEIEHDQMNTPAKVLGWVRQLSEKNWVTIGHIAELVAEADAIGVEIK